MNRFAKRSRILFTVIAAVSSAAASPGESSPESQQAGSTVEFRVTTVSYGGEYAEKNVGAIWVEDAQNNFVKTLELWAAKREKHLVNWRQASGGNTVDAITGATEKAHRTHTVTWNCTDVNGNTVSDGAYRLYVEFTEDNSSSSGNPPGKVTMVEFTKGPSDKTIIPPDEKFFINMQLVYTAGGAPPPSPASLSGTVKESGSNAPLAGATVRLKSGNQITSETTTGAAGTFSLTDIPPATYSLTVFKDGYTTHAEDLTLAPGQKITGKEIILEKVNSAASLSGTVVDADSRLPVQDVTIQLRTGNQVAYETRSDGAGGFSFAQVPAGSYTLLGFKSGYHTWSESITLASGDIVTGKQISLSPIVVTDTTPPAPPVGLKAELIGK